MRPFTETAASGSTISPSRQWTETYEARTPTLGKDYDRDYITASRRLPSGAALAAARNLQNAATWSPAALDDMRVVAVLAAYNEARFIGPCLEHLIRQGVDVYLLDNSSTDDTVAIASRYLGRGLIDIESCPRQGRYSWRPLLEHKERVFATVDADWFMHVDADEIRLWPPQLGESLAEAFAEVERQGYNAVNFLEFTFTPTRESPDHDHPLFLETMRWYYPLAPPGPPSQVKAWRRQQGPVDLASSAGHHVNFPGVRVYPVSFPMRHYMFLSVSHAVRKYVEPRYDPSEVAAGWHRAREALRAESITLPAQSELRYFVSDAQLDASNPRPRHFLFASSGASRREAAGGP